MGGPSYESLSRRARGRLLASALLRPTASAGALLLLYYRLPLDGVGDKLTVITLVVGLALLGVLIVWQVRAITTAPYPRVRAIEALASTLAFFLFLFAASYVVVATAQPDSFSEVLSRTDSLYFTVTTFSSVGYGDIVPRSSSARALVMVQMMGGLALLGAGARVLLNAVQVGLRSSKESGE
jgi:voltage-gated potassium channel